ncbi:MAG: hypothetical protein ACD_17C00150G0002 [uncultured bacterium]|nr:MAG: hypothetical protein ACD_17C00150G0002 [uncultured bacterium]OGN55370.1 MAG: hypothetical protein A2796_02415 [Chlamydiae bacterium RIFCSPHIGHO2_01_FULL_44_39]OGN57124.1 MAG: hypothetical protein A3C42_01785 [Chlamydiae bacterium RIFCSPHIGHO2_02_FULL_45_9]OGN59873.1 MAG: hypothetical protein A3D96_03730 [Chlamydiae bacterium RIFCSPHIGHO2_12_FULL_44_59]OGN66080.1 MAG: hypothetical protein A2978_04245 [Chlamydiae bacterium RIFCSPLOWO2_01_FULL_44_52]OGN68616.1 MAG: hypothetical protein A3
MFKTESSKSPLTPREPFFALFNHPVVSKTIRVVSEFFSLLVRTLYHYLSQAWKCISSTPAAKLKSSPYVCMPKDPILFIQKSCTIYRNTLDKEELAAFNELCQGTDPACFMQILVAVVKAYVYSKCQEPFDFLKYVEKVPGRDEEPAYNADGRLIHAGGQQYRSQTKTHFDSLKILQQTFLKLLPKEKETLVSTNTPQVQNVSTAAQELHQQIFATASAMLSSPTAIEALQSAWKGILPD